MLPSQRAAAAAGDLRLTLTQDVASSRIGTPLTLTATLFQGDGDGGSTPVAGTWAVEFSGTGDGGWRSGPVPTVDGRATYGRTAPVGQQETVTATLVAAGLVLVLGITVAAVSVPYVRESPGPTVDVLGTREGKPVVEVEGRRTFPTEGSLRLTTVLVTQPERAFNLLGALGGWFARDTAVLPYEAVYPDDTTAEDEQADQRPAGPAAQSAHPGLPGRDVGGRGRCGRGGGAHGVGAPSQGSTGYGAAQLMNIPPSTLID